MKLYFHTQSKKLLLILVVLLLAKGNFSYAQVGTDIVEGITSYDSEIIVNTDNSINVTETVMYNTGQTKKHGIFRNIYLKSSQGRDMEIKDLSVTDESGYPFIFETKYSRDMLQVKIGDPDRTFTGTKKYIIKYRATDAVGQLEALDEIYWNVTGNEWDVVVYKTHASVVLPEGIIPSQSACYYGRKGENKSCEYTQDALGKILFENSSALNSGEGMTIAVGFSKGVMTPYVSKSFFSRFLDTHGLWLIIISIIPLVTGVFSYISWYRKGKEARKLRAIVPQYDIPGDLTPLELGGIVNENVKLKDLSAEIIYLATKGYISIRHIEEQRLKFFKSTDYELTRLKDFSDLPNEFDRKLLSGLFDYFTETRTINFGTLFGAKVPILKVPPTPEENNKTIRLSTLKNTFYIQTSSIKDLVLEALLKKGYYKNLGKMKGRSIFSNFLLILGVLMLFRIGDYPGAQEERIFLGIAILLSIIIHKFFYHHSPSKTEKGIMVLEHALGLKQYLRIAEKARLNFHNAPEKQPELFETLLPYAMVLGVVDIWAKEFEGIYTTPPKWYSDSYATFSPTVFSHSISNFSSFTFSSLTSSPGSIGGVGGVGGSGGSGSSGGGGGGGGGGSW